MSNELSIKQRRLILGAVAVGTFMGALDTSIVNIALPSMSKYFNTPFSRLEWVVMAYLLIISSLLLTYGRLGDMYGHKRIYITGFVIFTVGSFLCGISPTIAFLIFCRAIQAIGAGMLMSMGPAIVTDITPPRSRGKALGFTAIAVSVALTTGPVLGGILTSRFGWQSIFYVNIPVGILGTIFAQKIIPLREKTDKQTFDIKGSILIFLTLVSILFPLNYAEKLGWHNPIIIGLLITGIVFFIIFIFVENKTVNPAVDLNLFKNRLFSMSNISSLLNFLAQFSVTLIMPFYLQQLRGFTPSRAGLMLIPMPITTMIVAPLSGALSDRVDSRYISSAGMGVAALGILQLSFLNENTSMLKIALALVTFGLGVGLFQTPNNSAIMGSVPDNRRGIASSILATMRNIGMVLGIAISGAIFNEHVKVLTKSLALSGVKGIALKTQAFLGGLHVTFLVGVLFAVMGIVTSLIRGSLKTKAL
jgi:EmrB/QacA subfamily drug resistance transporter